MNILDIREELILVAALPGVRSADVDLVVSRGELAIVGDIHAHVPASAISKDGPSAGVAMFMPQTSLLLNRVIDPAAAMTGEISLCGLVLPVGGIREKVVAAARAGITTDMLAARNRRDWDDILPGVRNGLRFVWLETVDDAFAAALPGGSGNAASARSLIRPRKTGTVGHHGSGGAASVPPIARHEAGPGSRLIGHHI